MTVPQASPHANVYFHPTALVDTPEAIGAGTRIWAFAHVMSGARIGRNGNLGDHVFVEGGVVVGDDVVVKNGVSLWNGITVDDGVFIGPAVTFTNDRVPRAKLYRDSATPTLLSLGASLGANCTVLCGTVIGRHAVVGAGAVVTRDVPDHGLVVGVPARLVGYVCRCSEKLQVSGSRARCSAGHEYEFRNGQLDEVR